MPRSALRVRPAGLPDLAALVDLAGGLREALLPAADAGLRRTSPGGRAALELRLREALTRPDRWLVLVVDDEDTPLGMALFSVAPANALLDAPALHMSHAVVGDRHRRRGAGKALVAAAAAHAEDRGLDQVVVSVGAGSREANRFFARLGFAPLAVRRAASVTAVRRRLAQSEAAHAGPRVGLARRRRTPLASVSPAAPEWFPAAPPSGPASAASDGQPDPRSESPSDTQPDGRSDDQPATSPDAPVRAGREPGA